MPASVPGDLISSPNSVCPYGLEMSLRSSAPPRCGPRYRPVQVNGTAGAGRGADARGGPSAAAVPATKSSASTAPARRKTIDSSGRLRARGAHPLARGDRASVSSRRSSDGIVAAYIPDTAARDCPITLIYPLHDIAASPRDRDPVHDRSQIAAAKAGSAFAAPLWVPCSQDHDAGEERPKTHAMTDLSIRTMRPDEIAIAVDWAAAEGWNPGLADAACFATVDPGRLPDRRARRRAGRDHLLRQLRRALRLPRLLHRAARTCAAAATACASGTRPSRTRARA